MSGSVSGDGLATRLAGLSPAKRAVLEQRLLERGRRPAQTIQARPLEAPVPLSFAQRRFWFVDQLDPRHCVNNVPRALHLRGPLRVSALQATLNALVARHAALRTTFPIVSGQPVQDVLAEATLSLPVLPTEAEALQAWLERETRRPFDLSRELPVRAALLRLGPAEHVLLLTMHHIASDGWSAGILDRELSAFYATYAGHPGAPLTPLPIQYADFSAWQHEAVAAGRFDRQVAYWRRQLDGAPACLALPTDRPRPPAQTFRGSRTAMHLPPDLQREIKHVALSARTTPFVVLLAAFQALLGRLARQSDVVVGSPVAGRNQPETAGLIGCFINSVALRADLSGNPTFLDLVGQVRATVLGALNNQDLPFDKLVEELRPTREPAYSPVFQAMFALQNVPRLELTLAHLDVRQLEVEVGASRLDLTLVVEEAEGDRGWHCFAEYNTGLFDAATIASFLESYRGFLSHIAANPSARIEDVPVASPPAAAMSIVVNAHPRTRPAPDSIAQAFVAQARRAPDAIAVTSAGRSLTYAELDRRSDRLAHLIAQHGIGAGQSVGVLVERSTETIVALLAVLKAGAAYVPVDAAYPEERVVYMLADAEARVLLADRDLGYLQAQADVQVVRIDHVNLDDGGASTDARLPPIGPDAPAYIMYTSGSTGQPKGVVVPQRAVLGLVLDTDYIHLSANDRVALVSSLAFDAATFEIWGALLNGACLVGIERATLLSPADMAHSLREHGITTLFLTTALFNRYAHELPRAFACLETLLFGGEAVDASSVRAVLEHGRPKRLLHVYGPTEATTFATWFEVEHVGLEDTTVPIGRPVAGTSVLVLDERRQPVRRGQTGELYLGGSRLAIEYLHAPDLTAERFVADPSSGLAGARLYRTGDLVRMEADGNLVFVGRRDQQVKIRGFRVEPGEVEQALSRHPNVREAIVIARAETGGTKRLVAYVTPCQAPPPQPAELRAHLASILPEFMLPAEYVVLDSLPLGPQGKVDRSALAAASGAARAPSSTSDAPRTEVERAVERIWAEVLGLERVGLRDNFFDLGGHSLLAAQLFMRLAERFKIRLPLSSLFPNATIEAQAALVTSQARSSAGVASSIVPLQPLGSGPPFVWVHAIDGDVLRFEPLARALGTRRPFLACRAQGLQDGTQPLHDVHAIASGYARDLRAAYSGPYLLGGFSSGATIAFELARQLVEQGEQVALLVLVDGAAPGRRWRSWREVWDMFSYLPVDLYHYVAHALEPEQRFNLAQIKIRAVRNQVRRWLSPGAQRQDRRVPAEVLEAVADFSPRHYSVALAHHAALERYVPGEFSGDALVVRSRVRRMLGLQDRELGWARLVHGHLEVHSLPGRHDQLLREPFVHAVAQVIQQASLRTLSPAAELSTTSTP